MVATQEGGTSESVLSESWSLSSWLSVLGSSMSSIHSHSHKTHTPRGVNFMSLMFTREAKTLGCRTILSTIKLQSETTSTTLYGGREVQRLTSVIRHPSSVICHPSSVIRHPSSVISFLVGAVMGVACLLASAHVF